MLNLVADNVYPLRRPVVIAMRKLEALRNTPDNRDYTLSLVPWGLMRRLACGQKAKAVFGFVPRHELAVFHKANFVRPCAIFHFANKAIADEMYHKIAQAILRGGIYAPFNLAQNADPKKVRAEWNDDDFHELLLHQTTAINLPR
jgi:hypothetical protein